MMIMASIFLSGLGWVVLQACFVGWVGSISYWVGLGWITENGPTSMSGSYRPALYAVKSFFPGNISTADRPSMRLSGTVKKL